MIILKEEEKQVKKTRELIDYMFSQEIECEFQGEEKNQWKVFQLELRNLWLDTLTENQRNYFLFSD